MPYGSIKFCTFPSQPFLPCPVCKGLFLFTGLVSSDPYCLFVALNTFVLLWSLTQHPSTQAWKQLPVWGALGCWTPRKPQLQLREGAFLSRDRVYSSRQTGASDWGGIAQRSLFLTNNAVQYLLAWRGKKSVFCSGFVLFCFSSSTKYVLFCFPPLHTGNCTHGLLNVPN